MCTNKIKIKTKDGEEYLVKCGKCDTCRREKAQEWAIKLINESKYHKTSCFITLTFDNRILREGNKYGANCSFLFHIENSKEYFTKFIKRLRKAHDNISISYYHIGEYGEKTKRPHHHAIIYGYNFPDKVEMEKSKSGKIQYFSQELFNLWRAGRISVQELNSNNTIYISQYTLKKFKDNEGRYKSIQSFSNRSKINSKWINNPKNKTQIIKGYIEDEEGKRYRIPKSYKKALKDNPTDENLTILMQYENNIIERIDKIGEEELERRQKIKEEINKIRYKNKIRDF